MITLNFSAEMQKRFLDRPINDALSKTMRRFFATAGGSIRTTARRLLKRKASKSLSELTEDERVSFLARQRAYRAGRSKIKPVKPDKTSPAGQPPRLHSAKSPLKERLLFAITEDKKAVVIGPELLGRNATRAKAKRRGISSMEQLERNNPFMVPAFEAIVPRLPSYLAKSVK